MLALCQTLGNKEYHSQKKEREKEREKWALPWAHALVGELQTEETLPQILNQLPFYTCYAGVKNLLGSY